MDFLELSSDYSVVVWASLALLAFISGFIDAVVGGGGLIQIPALLINLPNQPLPTIFGTNKIASLAGTSNAAWQYSKRIKFNWPLLLVVSFFAFVFSYAGAKTVSHINVEVLKPAILFILILIAIYTFIKKELGSVQTKQHTLPRQLIIGSIMGAIVGFYDGFFGPGTGSFLVLGFVVLLGFEFVAASAYSKIINCMTNISALIVFIRQGNYLLEIALLMAVCNAAGGILGSRIALKRGNSFVRILFLVIVSLMIIRYGYDVFMLIK